MRSVISPEYRRKLQQLVDSGDSTFSVLVALAGLDPRVDFRYANLQDVDFRGSDIRGFDFSHADLLRGIKDSKTLIDSTTQFGGAQIGWIEAESPDVIHKMLVIQGATRSTERRRLLTELAEQTRSKKHIHQFLITSMIKSKSIEAFFDFANAIVTIEDPHANLVIRDELRSLVQKRGNGIGKGRKKLAQTPYGSDLTLKLLEDSINPLLRQIAERIDLQKSGNSQSAILEAIGDVPQELF